MKTLNLEKLVVLAVAVYSVAGTGCSMTPGGNGAAATASSSTETSSGSTTNGTSGGTTAGPGVTSISTTAPNVDNITARVLNALTLPPAAGSTTQNAPLVSATAGNCATAILQQTPNLSTTSDPATATGGGAPPLIAYGCCNDVKATSYGVTTTSSIATETTALVAAGLTIVNQCTANLAAAGTTLNPQVSSIFSTLVSQDSTSGATTAQAFISVCTAAASFCTTMLSF